MISSYKAASIFSHHPEELLGNHRKVQVLGKRFWSLLPNQTLWEQAHLYLLCELATKQNFQMGAMDTTSVLLFQNSKEIYDAIAMMRKTVWYVPRLWWYFSGCQREEGGDEYVPVPGCPETLVLSQRWQSKELSQMPFSLGQLCTILPCPSDRAQCPLRKWMLSRKRSLCRNYSLYATSASLLMCNNRTGFTIVP